MSGLQITGAALLIGWLIGAGFLTWAYHRAGPIWIERHSLRFTLGGKKRRCSGAIGEMAILGYSALLLWIVDAITPSLSFFDILIRHPVLAAAGFVFASGIVAAYTVSEVEHPDAATKRRLRQTYAIYSVFSTLLFGGGMILIFALVTQFGADTRNFAVEAEPILADLDAAAAGPVAETARAVEFAHLDAMRLLKRAQDQMTPVFIFAIAIFTLNLIVLYTPIRALYRDNAVLLTNISTLIAIAAVGAAGAIVYIKSYNAFLGEYLGRLIALPRDIVSADALFQRRYTDILLAAEGKSSLVGFIGDLSREWGGLTAVVGVVQAASARLAKKPEIAGALHALAIEVEEPNAPAAKAKKKEATA
ncbi:MAG: hypothetical protein ABL957_14580 [Parvularculaceae bacterium]